MTYRGISDFALVGGFRSHFFESFFPYSPFLEIAAQYTLSNGNLRLNEHAAIKDKWKCQKPS
ncbi:MAG: hypothetical protein ACXWMW_08005, partial [Syntrophales bacterium]